MIALIALLAALIPQTPARGIVVSASTITAITSPSGGTDRNDFNGYLGFKFTPSANLTVSQLGRWVLSGNNQTHTLRLFVVGTLTELANVTVNTSGATVGAYLYGSITPQSLTSGTEYAVISEEVSGSDHWLSSDASVTFSGDFSAQRACYGFGFGDDTVNAAFVPVNFKYTKP